MRTVIDVGCARYGGDHSIDRLIERFDLKRPDLILGFDPNTEALAETLDPNEEYPCNIILSPLAAWIFDGQVNFVADGLNGWVSLDIFHPEVPCFDLAAYILRLENTEIVVKMDAEGSEYYLLKHLIRKKADDRLQLALVEWHCPECGRGSADRIGHRQGCSAPDNPQRKWIERAISCPIEEWSW